MREKAFQGPAAYACEMSTSVLQQDTYAQPTKLRTVDFPYKVCPEPYDGYAGQDRANYQVTPVGASQIAR